MTLPCHNQGVFSSANTIRIGDIAGPVPRIDASLKASGSRSNPQERRLPGGRAIARAPPTWRNLLRQTLIGNRPTLPLSDGVLHRLGRINSERRTILRGEAPHMCEAPFQRYFVNWKVVFGKR